MHPKRIAVIGAGPVGLEAALRGSLAGHAVRVYERGRVGENMRSWGHVTLFSPWSMNHSAEGARVLREAGRSLPGDEELLGGKEHAERYLRPLAESPLLRGRVREGFHVVGIGRDRLAKDDLLGGPRHRHPFRLLLEGPEGEETAEADVILDCSGTYGHHLWMGNGNLPAEGERALERTIDYTLVDLRGAARADFAGRRVLLVGDGYSAATALDDLLSLDNASVVWITRREGPAPYEVRDDDPLPERRRLSERANAVASSGHPRVDHRPGWLLERIGREAGAFLVRLAREGAVEEVAVDRVLAHVGYSPDRRLWSELQVHECYATGGPMRLAAALLAGAGGGGDCLAQGSKGAETLVTPEPGFFVLGARSYGRRSDFLIRLGIEQVREVFTLIDGRSAGDRGAVRAEERP